MGFLFLCSAGLFSQQKLPVTGQVDDIRFEAEQMTRGYAIITLKGNVQVTLNGVSVYADEAEYNMTTGDLMPQGHVRIRTRDIRSGKDQNNDPTDTPLRMPDSPWRNAR
ncbi:MAG: hypothetical protein ABSH47_14785 [Bryobacteraceae bacterium]